MKLLEGKWVLITGASSGLGLEMAKKLASQLGCHLILAARRLDRLEALKSEITSQFNVEVKTIKADLTNELDTYEVINVCLETPHFYGAILNAGMTYLGEHERIEDNQLTKIIQLNVSSTTSLATAFVRFFEDNQVPGRVMAISSLAAHYPTPYQALYSGTKGFITNFMNGLALETRNPDLKLSVFSPGGIITEMTEDEHFNDLRKWLMPVEVATEEAIKCFIKGKHNYVPGFMNRVAFAFMKVLPLRWITVMLGNQYRKALNL